MRALRPTCQAIAADCNRQAMPNTEPGRERLDVAGTCRIEYECARIGIGEDGAQLALGVERIERHNNPARGQHAEDRDAHLDAVGQHDRNALALHAQRAELMCESCHTMQIVAVGQAPRARGGRPVEVADQRFALGIRGCHRHQHMNGGRVSGHRACARRRIQRTCAQLLQLDPHGTRVSEIRVGAIRIIASRRRVDQRARRSSPPMYGRSAAGTVIEPSAF